MKKTYNFGEYSQKRVCTGSEHFYLFFDKAGNTIVTDDAVIKCRVFANDWALLENLIYDYNYNDNVCNVVRSEIEKDGKTVFQADFDFVGSKIKNTYKVKEQLETMLETFAREMRPYTTDIYAYYDKETGNVTLDEFVNVEGNSWLNDDHILAYRDDQHCDVLWDYITADDVAAALDKTIDDLKTATAEHTGRDLADVDEYDIVDMARDKYESEIETYWNEHFHEWNCDDYGDKAWMIVRELEDKIEEYYGE